MVWQETTPKSRLRQQLADLLDLLKNGAVSNFPEEDVSLHSEVCQAEVVLH